MKKICLIAIVVSVFISCKKSEQFTGDSGCISRIARQNYNIKPNDSLASIELLRQNSITYNSLQLEYYSTYTITGGDNPGTRQDVFAVQLVNGLPILSGEIWYDFNNGTLLNTTGTIYSQVNLDTHPLTTLPQLRSWYLSELNKTNTYNAASFKDSCLVAILGYYDQNVNVNSIANFTKAWRIKPKHSDYPQLTVQDGSGKVINYVSGLIFPD